jgi:hypothetical protein
VHEHERRSGSGLEASDPGSVFRSHTPHSNQCGLITVLKSTIAAEAPTARRACGRTTPG